MTGGTCLVQVRCSPFRTAYHRTSGALSSAAACRPFSEMYFRCIPSRSANRDRHTRWHTRLVARKHTSVRAGSRALLQADPIFLWRWWYSQCCFVCACQVRSTQIGSQFSKMRPRTVCNECTMRWQEVEHAMHSAERVMSAVFSAVLQLQLACAVLPSAALYMKAT